MLIFGWLYLNLASYTSNFQLTYGVTRSLRLVLCWWFLVFKNYGLKKFGCLVFKSFLKIEYA